MKPAPFRYHRPETLEEALALMADAGPDTRPLAGGQSLIPAMNFRLAQPAVLVDLGRLDELRFVRQTDAGLQIGAMTTQSAVEHDPAAAAGAPLLAETLPWIGHPQIRNRGTVGGSLAHADPAAELPVAAVAARARVRLQSVRNDRWLDASDFFLGLFATALEPGELLTEIELPAPADRSGSCFDEFARRHGDYALAGAAAVVEVDDAGQCGDCRLVLLGCGDGPLRVETAEQLLAGENPAAPLFEGAAEEIRRSVDPHSDLHASAGYRRHLAGVLGKRTLRTAWERALAARNPS